MIPEKFLLRMQTMLGEDYAAFYRAMTEEEAVRAFRMNTIKPSSLAAITAQMEATPIPDCENGYYTTCEKPGALYPHHAGMLYMQDPSAMTTVQAVSISPDWKILDACAAPGGKTTQMAACNGQGILVANEPNAARCRILQGNLERMGVRHAIVTQTTPDVLANTYPDYFDLVLTDAPCSGEGMFRKYPVAKEEWSEENVAFCAARQREILAETAKCVKVGGYLLYSTCTFSKEENEDTVADFLASHLEFVLCPLPQKVKHRTAPGLSSPACLALADTARFYPHIAKGEGQYIAWMQRKEGDAKPALQTSNHLLQPLSKKEEERALALLCDLLQPTSAKRVQAQITNGSLCLTKRKDTVYLCPNIPLPACPIYAYGTALADCVGERLVVHHHFYSAYGAEFANQLNLQEDGIIYRYLRGEEIEAPLAQNGYCAVLIHGCPTGGGKVSGGRLKNHYPKGLRNP